MSEGMPDIWEADRNLIRVEVAKDDDAKDFSGASVEAAMESLETGAVVAADIAPISDAAGQAKFDIDLTFAPGALVPGVWNLQAQVAKDGVPQTVVEASVNVLRSWVQEG